MRSFANRSESGGGKELIYINARLTGRIESCQRARALCGPVPCSSGALHDRVGEQHR